MKHSLHNLTTAVETLQTASIEQLSDALWLERLVRSVGLTWDPLRNEGNEEWQIEDNELGGINQTPEQFVPALLLLKNRRINNIIDVGTWNGWTISFIVSYLLRFNENVSAVTIDRSSHRSVEVRSSDVLGRLPILYCFADSRSISCPEHALKSVDLTIIDAGHAYADAKSDWEKFGSQARCCFFHDVNDDQCAKDQRSVKHLWAELKTDPVLSHKKKVELFEHPSSKSLMGIGLLIDEAT